MEIGNPTRVIVVEPLEDPVPREPKPDGEPAGEAAAPDRVNEREAEPATR